MIIDVHSHTPRQPPTDSDGITLGQSPGARLRPDGDYHPWTSEAYFKAMEVVDKAIVFDLAGDPFDTRPSSWLLAPECNDLTAAFVAQRPDKLIGFMSVHPRDPQALEEIERCYQDLGLKGIKMGCNFQNFDPNGEEAARVFQRAEEMGLPILFHTGTCKVQFADLDWAHPRHIDRVAMRFPKLKMILAHMSHPWYLDVITVIRKHPNVYADVSGQFYRPWQHYNCMRLAAEWSVFPKMLFASDYPVATPQETMDGMRRVNDLIKGSHLPPVPEDELEEIIHRNSLELLGLEA
jgi:predicted TIM-barrel fold metal-dependent hydrolase